MGLMGKQSLSHNLGLPYVRTHRSAAPLPPLSKDQDAAVMEARAAAAQEKQANTWWLDSHRGSKRSPWLVATLSELEEKTKEMLKLIEEDADSFAKRADMYYNKRPELVSMIEDTYRAHRSLAERFDQLRVEGRLRRTSSFDNSFLNKKWSPKIKNVADKLSESSESSFGSFDYSEESEVDDPEPENESKEMLSSEIERLKMENEILKAELAAKDEAKREVIRQLSLCVDIMKEENQSLWKCVKDSKKSGGLFEFKKLKKVIASGKMLLGGHSKSQTAVVAL